MSDDYYIHLPASDSLRAVVTTKTRDIAGRGYDETRVGLLTVDQTLELRRAVIDTAKRQAAERRKHRILELEAEIAALKGGDA